MINKLMLLFHLVEPDNACWQQYTIVKRINHHDLEVTVGIEARAVISFGLEVNVEVKAKAVMEVIMDNLIVFITCVWCGVAFLRAWWDTFNPNERSVIVNYLPDPGKTRGGSIPPPRTN
ncbi:hypothetical protein [Rheinheimera sp.]|uniref:hypothetical protein n=1 Tax=Rheinheimera sp. TaxID=1869214 RepID=UPI00261492BB|nr:hypothetical protein [Rheinheimera sp.]MCA1931434.1 hypothetical protein [Rheinheimera sp.]